MEDPGPNVLEQQIETNRLLALILAGAGGALPGSPGLAGGVGIQWPILFAWSNGTKHPFLESGSAGYSVSVVCDDAEHLSHDRAIYLQTDPDSPAAGEFCEISLGIPSGPLRAPRVQLAFMSMQYPIAGIVNIHMTYWDGTNQLDAGLQFNSSTLSLSYWNSGGTYTELGTMLYYNLPVDWNHADLSINFADSLYQSAGINGTYFDLSAIAVQSAASGLPRRLFFSIAAYNTSTSDYSRVFIDEILVTDGLHVPDL